jgi:hypothetical protein
MQQENPREPARSETTPERQENPQARDGITGEQSALVGDNYLVHILEPLDQGRRRGAGQPGDVRAWGMRAQSLGERRRHHDVAEPREPDDKESLSARG